jgi:hypothetical protein
MIARSYVAGIVTGIWLFLAAATSPAQEASSLQPLLDQYRCPIVDRLERIYAKGDPERFPDEYLIVDRPGFPEHYVQCLFYKRGKLYCEAASGFFFAAPDQPRTMHLSASSVAALAQLGFSTDDSHGNFSLYRDVTEPPDFGSIADLMLKALHDGYGARADTELDFHAPYAAKGSPKCVPVS